MVAVKGKHSKSVVEWSRMKRSGLFIRAKNVKEVEKIENVLSRLGVSPQGSRTSIRNWLSNFTDTSCIVFTTDSDVPKYSASRLEVFTSLDKKNHIEVSYKQLKKLAKDLGRRGALV